VVEREWSPELGYADFNKLKKLPLRVWKSRLIRLAICRLRQYSNDGQDRSWLAKPNVWRVAM